MASIRYKVYVCPLLYRPKSKGLHFGCVIMYAYGIDFLHESVGNPVFSKSATYGNVSRLEKWLSLSQGLVLKTCDRCLCIV